jgi:dTDP-4-amino-4,6-dideoxygalactose transaminase
MDAIRAALPEHVAIVEDAACASGAAYKGKPAGSLGDAGVFSFHPRKTITTGEGGMITTQSNDLAERMNRLRNHGASISEEQRHHGPKPYLLPEFNLLGFNYRMTDLQGSVGLVQLSKLDTFLAERDHWAQFYKEQLADLPWLQTPQAPENCRHGWQAYVCRINPESAPKPRNDIMEDLQQIGIATRPGTHAVHALGYYRERFGFSPFDYPNAWDCEQSTLAIPLHNRMSADDYQYVVNALKQIRW